MKLLITQINEGENHLQFQSDNEGWLKDVAQHLQNDGHELAQPIRADLRLTKLEPDYLLRGNLQFSVIQNCSRCAEPFPLAITHGFDVALAHVTQNPRGRALERLSEESEALDVQFFEGNEIDLKPIVQEQFFLSLPYQAVCKVDCKGVCQHCGRNLNLKADCGCAPANPLNPFALLREKADEGTP